MILATYGKNLLILTSTVRSRIQTNWSNPVGYNNPPVGDQPVPFFRSLILQAGHGEVGQRAVAYACALWLDSNGLMSGFAVALHVQLHESERAS